MAFVNRDTQCNNINDYKRHTLFTKRLTSIDTFQSILQSSAFVALDTESLGQDDRVLCQVGIAYSSSLVPVSAGSIGGKRSLRKFAQQNDISSTTINLIDKLLLEYDARRIADNKDRLILVVFEYRAEWSYMARFFPSALRYFSAWLDVIDFSREVAPGGNVPSLKKTLNPLGYGLWDVTHDRKSEGAAHNAGNDAVITLAILEGLQWPTNQAKLRSLQAYWRIISSHRGPPNLLRMPFTANIQTLDQTLLPKSLDSALCLSRMFFDEYHPKQISVSSQNPNSAWVTLNSLPQLNCFVDKLHGTTVYGKRLVVTSLYDPALALAETESVKNQEIKRQREALRNTVIASFADMLGANALNESVKAILVSPNSAYRLAKDELWYLHSWSWDSEQNTQQRLGGNDIDIDDETSMKYQLQAHDQKIKAADSACEAALATIQELRTCWQDSSLEMTRGQFQDEMKRQD
ncbi:hypothetical protein F4680DRAFT_469387 [Xylaria scruposa]|nr:hypothetical protein F4680DRAFT_469387 [Xylaria scruposa]